MGPTFLPEGAALRGMEGGADVVRPTIPGAMQRLQDALGTGQRVNATLALLIEALEGPGPETDMGANERGPEGVLDALFGTCASVNRQVESTSELVDRLLDVLGLAELVHQRMNDHRSSQRKLGDPELLAKLRQLEDGVVGGGP